jgi:hypothetical protein
MGVMVINKESKIVKGGCMAGQKRARHSKVEQQFFFH